MTVAVAHQHSPTALLVLAQGAYEASVRQTDLAVINVVETLDLDSREALQSSLTDEIQQALDEADLGGVTWKLHLAAEDEDVAGSIINVAVQAGADLLVIGARKRSPLGKYLMGSATQSIILEAPIPVLVVKGES